MHKEAEEELIRSGIVTAGDLHTAKEKSRSNRISILLNLLEGRSAESCQAITESLAQHYKIPMLSMKKIVPPQDLMRMCNARQVRKLHFLPVALNGSQIVVGMVDPLDLNYSDEIRAIFRRAVQPVFISLSDFEHSYYRYFRKGVTLPAVNPELMDTTVLQKEFLGEKKGELSDEEKEIIAKKFAAKIVSRALAVNASSFSIEPQQDVCLVNITLDGTDYNLYRFSISHHKPMVDAMMRLAKLDPSHHEGVDQFSRCQVKFKERNYILAYSFRLSPTGDKVVAHILDPALGSLTIDQTGLYSREQQHLVQALDSPGIIIVTGPCGSGKSVLLQTLTRHIVAQGKKPYTIEDVVGLRIDGARQFQVKPDGPTKSQILSTLRKKNAEVIVVDEIDKDSLPAAVECAEAGALLLLSVTAPDIREALSRLMRSGISRDRIASLLKMACTHKVIRSICPDCKSVDSPHPTTVTQWQLPDNVQFYTGKDCGECHRSGFKGTISLTELFQVSPKIAEMIKQGASGPELFQQARYEGLLTLIEKGMNKAIDGFTSVDEVLASVPFEAPFSVKGRMRMGRIMPLQGEQKMSTPARHTSISPPQKKTSKPTETVGSITFAGILPDTESAVEKEEIRQEEKQEAKHAEPAPVAAAPAAEQNDKSNILLLDDSPVTLEFTRHILEVSGYFNVDTADKASVALQMLQEKQYHLVITDQEMPEQTGQEFIESIRQHPALNSVGTILLTGNLNEMSALGGGADGYIAKPTDPELLVARAKSISDIYRRLSTPGAAKVATTGSRKKPASAPVNSGKVDFTEKDMSKISNFELDIPTADISSNAATPEIIKADDDDMAEFENLFK